MLIYFTFFSEYYAALSVCGVPQSKYTNPEINGTSLDFTKSAVYQYNFTTNTPYGFGLADPNAWSYGTFHGLTTLSYKTTGGHPQGCSSGSATVIFFCYALVNARSVVQTSDCDCKNHTIFILSLLCILLTPSNLFICCIYCCILTYFIR